MFTNFLAGLFLIVSVFAGIRFFVTIRAVHNQLREPVASFILEQDHAYLKFWGAVLIALICVGWFIFGN